jgi:hypothetical protein
MGAVRVKMMRMFKIKKKGRTTFGIGLFNEKNKPRKIDAITIRTKYSNTIISGIKKWVKIIFGKIYKKFNTPLRRIHEGTYGRKTVQCTLRTLVYKSNTRHVSGETRVKTFSNIKSEHTRENKL